jgi:transitional endoplasmic reticulum ATPase
MATKTGKTEITKMFGGTELDRVLARARAAASDPDNDGKEKEVKYKNVQVERHEAPTILVPDGMALPTARDWLLKIEAAEEQEVALSYEIPAYPLDGARAMFRALRTIYQFVELLPTPSFFGERPPTMVDMQVDVDKFEQIPWGRMTPPGFAGFLETSMGPGPVFKIVGKVRKKHLAMANEIARLTQEILTNDSAYKGKAVRVNLGFMAGETIDFRSHTPKFLDVASVSEDDLIINEVTRLEFIVSVWSRLERTKEVRKMGQALKHGALLKGKYGTGKTLAALITAAKAVANGWTFLYLENAHHLEYALRFAELYAPCVIFAEDIDKVVGGSARTDAINRLLNTLDGMDTKTKPIITVLTTNHPEQLNEAFLRAGRIDTIIDMPPADQETSQVFARKFLGTKLAEGQDLTNLGVLLDGYVAAFIKEVVAKAILNAVYHHGTAEGKVTALDLETAAKASRDHVNMVEKQHVAVTPTPVLFAEEIEQTIHRAVRKDVELTIREHFQANGWDLPNPRYLNN